MNDVPEITENEYKELIDRGFSPDQIKEAAKGLTNKTGFELVDSPTQPHSDDLLKFLRDILNLKGEDYQKISRIGYLKDEEIGHLSTPVRPYLAIAHFNKAIGNDIISNYLAQKSNIWNDPSLARKGFLLKLPFSMTKINKDLGTPKKTVQNSLFGGSKEVIEGVED
jgi:hypothetical protein